MLLLLQLQLLMLLIVTVVEIGAQGHTAHKSNDISPGLCDKESLQWDRARQFPF